MKEVDEKDRPTVRQRLASQTGFTSLSILHRFHWLYQFDVLKNLTFNTVHTLVLCVINRYLQHYNKLDLLKNPDYCRKCLGKREDI